VHAPAGGIDFNVMDLQRLRRVLASLLADDPEALAFFDELI